MMEWEFEKIKKTIAREIRDARKRARLTQKELAERMGVTQPSISRIEKGESLPEKKTLVKIAKALDLPDDFFLEKLTPTPYNSSIKHIMDRLKEIEEKVNRKYSFNKPIPVSVYEDEEKVTVKEIEFPVGAGECFTNDNVIAHHRLPVGITYGATYMLRVRGKSMEPYIMDGEMILVIPQRYIERDGQLAVVNIANQVNAVKFVFVEGDKVGLGRSKKEAKWYPKDEIRIQGVVVNKISSYNVIREMEDRARES